jgi:hypothetical protein
VHTDEESTDQSIARILEALQTGGWIMHSDRRAS